MLFSTKLYRLLRKEKMNLPSLVLALLRVLLSVVFIISSVSKMAQPKRFAATITSFKIIPSTLAQPAAFALIGAEAAIAILLLIGWQTRFFALLYAILMLIFMVAVSLNILRGKKDLDCGCFGAKQRSKVNFKLLLKEFGLFVIALCLVKWGGGYFYWEKETFTLLSIWVRVPFLLLCGGIVLLKQLLSQLHSILLLKPLEEE